MKIILCGACGRMGRMVAELAPARGAEVVCGVDISPSTMPFPVYSSLQDVSERADIVIDFSSPKGLSERLSFCETHGIGIVLAVTGFSAEDERRIDRSTEKIPIFQSANFSLGIALMQALAKKAAEILGEQFDIEIIERHHRGKKDAPSGTALMLAAEIGDGLGGREYVYGRHNTANTRKNEIGIHSLRGGSIVGEHEVMFAGEDEILTISHSVRSRKIFASGALRAAEWLIGKPAGRYIMKNYIKNFY